MGEATKQFFDDQNFEGLDSNNSHIETWMIMKGGDCGGGGGDVCDSESIEYFHEDSMNSESSELDSESELTENASSSSFFSSSTSLSHSNDNGPLYELSELMIHLPIKRGLSKYYQGKSQSYVSLASVKSVEDLAKKDKPYTNRNKSTSKSKSRSKSYACGFEGHKFYTPKATISKRTQRASFLSLVGNNNYNRSALVNSFKAPVFSNLKKI